VVGLIDYDDFRRKNSIDLKKFTALVVGGWMNSTGHRKNIMNANFTHIGIGHVARGNYWTQMFIRQ